MKVFNNNPVTKKVDEICNISLNTQAIQFNDILNDGLYISIPLLDKELLEAVNPLIDNTVMINMPEWMYPDYDNSKLALFIDTDNENFNVCLSIEARPYKYTEEEKAAILSKVKKEPTFIYSDWNEYDNWRTIFASADAFHAKKYNNGVICTYSIELTQKEQNKLMWEINLSQ